MSRDHRKLRAFELADQLALAVYESTRAFPRDEQFGLTSQMRRAAVSAAANIVEGSARANEREFRQFLCIALGSLRETGYHISLAARLGYLDETTASRLHGIYDEGARVLSGLIAALGE